MIEQNDYVKLYKSKVQKAKFKQFALEIGYIHNALGLIIKEFVMMLQEENFKMQKPAQKQSNTNTRKFQTYKVNNQSESNKIKQKDKLIIYPSEKIKEINKDESILESFDSSTEHKSKFDAINSRIEQFRTQTPDNTFYSSSYLSGSGMLASKYELEKQIKKPVYREGKRHNDSKEGLKGVECQMCQKFYGAFEGEIQNGKRMCKHNSRHKTSAPYAKIKSFSQQFDDL